MDDEWGCTTSSCRTRTTLILQQERMALQDQQREAEHVHGCTDLATELVVLVLCWCRPRQQTGCQQGTEDAPDTE